MPYTCFYLKYGRLWDKEGNQYWLNKHTEDNYKLGINTQICIKYNDGYNQYRDNNIRNLSKNKKYDDYMPIVYVELTYVGDSRTQGYTYRALNGKYNSHRGTLNYVNGLLHCIDDQPLIIDSSKVWYKYGRLHRDGDLPAIETLHGTQYWFKNNRLHRDGNLPAIVCDPNKIKGRTSTTDFGLSIVCIDIPLRYVKFLWAKNGKVHRDEHLGPAIICFDNEQRWYKNNELHRSHGLPAVCSDTRTQYWMYNKEHRNADKPAVFEFNKDSNWFIHGIRHRDFKPLYQNNRGFYYDLYDKSLCVENKHYNGCWIELEYHNLIGRAIGRAN